MIIVNLAIGPAIKHADAWDGLLREADRKSYYRKLYPLTSLDTSITYIRH